MQWGGSSSLPSSHADGSSTFMGPKNNNNNNKKGKGMKKKTIDHAIKRRRHKVCG
jgi:hypothetical protein